MNPDEEPLLLSWAQLEHALWLLPDHAEYRAARQQIERLLAARCGISALQLLARSFEMYTVSYAQGEGQQLARFAADDVEDFS